MPQMKTRYPSLLEGGFLILIFFSAVFMGNACLMHQCFP